MGFQISTKSGVRNEPTTSVLLRATSLPLRHRDSLKLNWEMVVAQCV